MGNQNQKSPSQEASEKKLGTALTNFLNLAKPPAKLHHAIKALTMHADCTKLDEDYTKTILLYLDFLEYNNL